MGMPLVYHPDYSVPLPSSHRFPMAKFRLLHDLLCRRGHFSPGQLHQPLPVPRRILEQVHDRSYHEAISHDQLSDAERRRIGLPATRPLVRRSWLAVGGTLLTTRLALRHGLACHLAGGTHHAFASFGSGFCIFNDVAVAARQLLAEGSVGRVMVVDLDVHQGDGTAALFVADPRVFTFSAHGASNFPLRKQTSDHDLPLADGTDDDTYLRAVAGVLPDLLDDVRPDLVIYNAGVDPHRDDRLGRLALSNAGLLRRDELVLEACLQRGMPVATVIGGGYDGLDNLVERHGLVFEAAAAAARRHRL
ncbi:MAG: histone deacetylase [Synechococcus sp. Tobar2m-G35]|nr:histone deacetylase [Synechococcus sp. Tobar2m-G35]